MKYNTAYFSISNNSHTRKEGISVAHSLARYAINIPYFLVWIEDVPPQFHFVVQANLDSLHK